MPKSDEEARPPCRLREGRSLLLAHTMDTVDDALVARSSAVTDWNRTDLNNGPSFPPLTQSANPTHPLWDRRFRSP